MRLETALLLALAAIIQVGLKARLSAYYTMQKLALTAQPNYEPTTCLLYYIYGSNKPPWPIVHLL